MANIGLWLTLLPLIIWVILLTCWGQFWQTDQLLESSPSSQAHPTPNSPLPTICTVIPARNEAEALPVTLRSLLCQDYPGTLSVFLVDDNSTDGTANVARETASLLQKEENLQILQGKTLPSGWTGKLWALEQGIQQAKELSPDYILLTDADIEHDVANLSRLVSKAVRENFDLVSVMVRLRCESFWEKLLIPAFVFFFQKLYPFRWVNNPNKKTAAAAGGCILVKTEALERIGGIQVLRQALIDDCSLAAAIKSSTPSSPSSSSSSSSPIWLGLSSLTRSLRPYPDLGTIWDMVARTAFTQLNYSPFLLMGTLVGMILVYLASPLGLIWGIATSNWLVAACGLFGWLLMSLAYFPTVRFYKCSPVFAFCLPLIGFLYTLMTFDSALRHWQGRGGAWKGRVYQQGG